MNYTIKSLDNETELKLYKDKAFLYQNFEMYEKFVQGVEDLVRMDPRYTRYIGHLRNVIGLDSCAFMGKLSGDKTELEMHHGPVFTLFDVVDIMTRYYILKGCTTVNTPFIANAVLNEHEDNNVQIVLLNKMIHRKGVHGGQFFLHVKSSYGRVDRFIEKYKSGMELEHIDNALYFLKMCKEYDGNIDNGLLEVAKNMESFKGKLK